jgi:hypothetical protein
MTMTPVDQLSREQLIDILNAVGGTGADLAAVADPMPILINTIARVTDAAKLDRALEKPQTFETRAALTARKIELIQPANVAPRREPAYPGLTVFVPECLAGMTHFIDGRGNSREVRIEHGKRVLDLTPGEFHAFLGGTSGLHWQRANEGGDVFRKMQPGLHIN